MHQTVQLTFKAFEASYFADTLHDDKINVLEIGSKNINGGLKDLKLSSMDWTGVDIEAGPGVDEIIKIGEPLPFADQVFDLVVASSVFEHDIEFWSTFLEMSRVTKNAGLLLLVAPSQGTYHRFPLDVFRFYPDAGIALEKWAQKNRRPIKLIESFITEPDKEGWADFVAIFSVSPELYESCHLGGQLRVENWIVGNQLMESTFQEFPYEMRSLRKLEVAYEELSKDFERVTKHLNLVVNSYSWRLTIPLRILKKFLRKS